MYRTFDFLLALVGILVLLPFLSIVFLLTWIDLGSPIFIQTRMGRNEVPFLLYKFRTMRRHAPENRLTGTISPTHITRLGRFLRHYKIDELPQLWNVLIGEMSLVGPRPNIPEASELIERRRAHKIYDVRPGITGFAQLNRVNLSMTDEVVNLERDLIEQMSVGLYLLLIFNSVMGQGRGDTVL